MSIQDPSDRLPTMADADLPERYQEEMRRRKAAEAKVADLEADLAATRANLAEVAGQLGIPGEPGESKEDIDVAARVVCFRCGQQRWQHYLDGRCAAPPTVPGEPDDYENCDARDGRFACQLPPAHSGAHVCPDDDLSKPVHEWPRGPRCKGMREGDRCYLDRDHTGGHIFDAAAPPTVPGGPPPTVEDLLGEIDAIERSWLRDLNDPEAPSTDCIAELRELSSRYRRLMGAPYFAPPTPPLSTAVPGEPPWSAMFDSDNAIADALERAVCELPSSMWRRFDVLKLACHRLRGGSLAAPPPRAPEEKP